MNEREHLERVRRFDEAKDEFVALVSQELRTPLTSVRGYLDLVLDGSAGELTDQQARFLDVAARNCGRLEQLVDDLLLIAHAQAGRLTLEWTEVDLVAMAREAVEAAQAAAGERDVELVLVSAGSARLLADAARLRRLVDGALANAVTFTAGGGSIEISVRVRRRQAVLEVTDTAASREVPGAGLGLAVSKAIAEAHGGTIEIESRPGGGATFRMIVPTHLGAEAAA